MKFRQDLSKKGSGRHSSTVNIKTAAKVTYDEVQNRLAPLMKRDPELASDILALAKWAQSSYKGLLEIMSYLAAVISSENPQESSIKSSMKSVDTAVEFYARNALAALRAGDKSQEEKRKLLASAVSGYQLFGKVVRTMGISHMNPDDISGGLKNAGNEVVQKFEEISMAGGGDTAGKTKTNEPWRSPTVTEAKRREFQKRLEEGIKSGVKRMASLANQTTGCPNIDDATSNQILEVIAGLNPTIDALHIQRTIKEEKTARDRVSNAGFSIGQLTASMYLENTLRDTVSDPEVVEKVAKALESHSQSGVDYGKMDSLWGQTGFSDKLIAYLRSKYRRADLVSSAAAKKRRRNSLSNEEWAKICEQFFNDVKRVMTSKFNPPDNDVVEKMFSEFPNYQSPFYNALKWFDFEYNAVREKTEKTDGDMAFLKMYANKGESWGESISGHSIGLANLIASRWTSMKHVKNENGEGYIKADRSVILPKISKALLHSVIADAGGNAPDTSILYGDKDVGVDNKDVNYNEGEDSESSTLNLPLIPPLPSFLGISMNTKNSSMMSVNGLFSFSEVKAGPGYVFLANAVTIFNDLVENSKGETSPSEMSSESPESGEAPIDLVGDESLEITGQRSDYNG